MSSVMSITSGLLRFRNNILVSLYRYAGILILLFLLAGLTFYVTSVIYFVLSDKWATPIILSPEHDKVIQFRNNYIAASVKLKDVDMRRLVLNKDIASEKSRIGASLKQLKSQKKYLQSSLSRYRHELKINQGMVRKLRREVKKYNTSFRKNSRAMTRSLHQELRAGLITREQKLQQETAMANMGIRSVDFSMKIEELNKRALMLKDNVKASRALLKTVSLLLKQANDQPLSASFAILGQPQSATPETVTVQKDIQTAATQIYHSSIHIAGLQKENVVLNKTGKLVKENTEKLEQSPLAQAQNKKVYVAFVPYENVANFQPSSDIRKCWFYFWCSSVGTVQSVVPGEIVSNHPLFKYPVRGQFVMLDLKNQNAARTWLLQH